MMMMMVVVMVWVAVGVPRGVVFAAGGPLLILLRFLVGPPHRTMKGLLPVRMLLPLPVVVALLAAELLLPPDVGEHLFPRARRHLLQRLLQVLRDGDTSFVPMLAAPTSAFRDWG
jgi:hypothetical protein